MTGIDCEKINWGVIGRGMANQRNARHTSAGKPIFLPDQVVREVGERVRTFQAETEITRTEDMRAIAHDFVSAAEQAHAIAIEGGAEQAEATERALAALKEAVVQRRSEYLVAVA